MRYKILLLIAFLILAVSSCYYNDDGLVGRGPLVSESRAVDPFTSINSSLPANVFITQESEQSLRVETHENILPLVRTNVVNGELYLELTGNTRNVSQINVYISAPDYERLRLSGAANIRSDNCLELDELEVRLSGAGNISLCGEVDELNVHISGAGNFQGYGMVGQVVDARVSGAGNMRVTAEQTLDVTISGAGSIFYKGNPQINSDISGAGSLINAN